MATKDEKILAEFLNASYESRVKFYLDCFGWEDGKDGAVELLLWVCEVPGVDSSVIHAPGMGRRKLSQCIQDYVKWSFHKITQLERELFLEKHDREHQINLALIRIQSGNSL